MFNEGIVGGPEDIFVSSFGPHVAKVVEGNCRHIFYPPGKCRESGSQW